MRAAITLRAYGSQVLEFNALTENVPLPTGGFVDDARELTWRRWLCRLVAPDGNVSIHVLVKEQAHDNAMTCFSIATNFQSVEQVLLRKTTQNATLIVDAILSEAEALISNSSLSDKVDVVVSLFLCTLPSWTSTLQI